MNKVADIEKQDSKSLIGFRVCTAMMLTSTWKMISGHGEIIKYGYGSFVNQYVRFAMFGLLIIF